MSKSSRRVWLTLALVVGGCAGANPFIAARIATGRSGNAGGGGNTTEPSDNISRSCDLVAERKSFSGFGLLNESGQVVQYSITLLASAGVGGFVCDEDIDDYQRAGYRALSIDPVTRTATIGCDPVPLLRGTQILALRLTGSIAAANDPLNPILASSPLNGAVRIPIPEMIVVGDSQALFICQGANACTQGGFVYTDIAGNPIRKVTATRSQGTVCNVRAGSLPEWRLLDPAEDDLAASAFQYTTGSFVTLRVLDRAASTDQNVNQVVWNVTSVDGTVIHDFQP